MSDPPIEIIPTSYQEVLDLLHSDALQAVERPIADAVTMRIVEDYSTTSTTYTQAEISVSGLTVAEIASLLDSKRDVLIRFGAALLRDDAATDESEEFPPGEEQDPSELVESHGLGVGIGIKYAIYFNFLTNRTPPEFRAFLKNRRIPGQAKFAKDLQRILDEVS